MLSKKLTFSLASLIVLLMIGLCLPVGAQEAQTVGITTATTIAANSFLVIGRGAQDDATPATGNGIMMDAAGESVAYQPVTDLQDLEAFFMAGGTIQLTLTGLDTDGGTEDTETRTPMMYDLVISEIMWGRDVNGAANATAKQWIEIYNTTDQEINLLGSAGANGVFAQLVFTPFTSTGSAAAASDDSRIRPQHRLHPH